MAIANPTCGVVRTYTSSDAFEQLRKHLGDECVIPVDQSHGVARDSFPSRSCARAQMPSDGSIPTIAPSGTAVFTQPHQRVDSSVVNLSDTPA